MTQKLSKNQVIADQFRVGELVRTTDVAEIYEAHDTASGQVFALEIITSREAIQPDRWKAFEVQTRDSATLASDVCTSVHQFGIDSRTHTRFLLREFVQAPSIRAQASAETPVAPKRVAELLSLLAPGFDKLHKADMAHCSLTPDNVYLADGPAGPTARVADFGHAELRSVTAEPIGWSPPEAAHRGPRATPTTDTYSLGLVAFFALTGHAFFKALQSDSIDQRALQTEQRRPPPPASKRAAELGANLPKSLDEFFARALANNPSRRFKSVGEMAEAFARAVGASVRPARESVVSPGTRMSAAPPPPPSPGSTPRNLPPPPPPSKRASGPPPPPSKTGRPPPPSATGALPPPAQPTGPAPSPEDVSAVEQASVLGDDDAVLEPEGDESAAAPDQATPGFPPVDGAAESGPGATSDALAAASATGVTAVQQPTGLGASVSAQVPATASAALSDVDLPAGLVKRKEPKRVLAIGGGVVAAVLLIAVLVSAMSSDEDAAETETAKSAAVSSPAPLVTKTAPTATSTAAAKEEEEEKEPEPERTITRFQCDPDCDNVTCDGKTLDDFTEGVELEPGKHRCIATKRGYLPSGKSVRVVEGESQDVKFKLSPIPRSAPRKRKRDKPVPRGRPCNPFTEPC